MLDDIIKSAKEGHPAELENATIRIAGNSVNYYLKVLRNIEKAT